MVDLAIGAGSREFRAGKILTRSIQSYWRNILLFCAIGVVVWSPMLLNMVLSEYLSNERQITSAYIFLLLLGTLHNGIVMSFVFHNSRKQTITIVDAVRQALKRYFPLLGTVLLFYLAMLAGFSLFVVPALFLVAMWYIAFPACLLEELGPIASLKRSAELTHGSRLRIIIVHSLVMVAYFVLFKLAAISMNLLQEYYAVRFIMPVWIGISQSFWAVLTATVYVELRASKNGLAGRHVADVFE
jgi:hypothetical protein